MHGRNPKAPLFPAFRTSSNDLERQSYDPYPDYNGRMWRKKWKGSYALCRGPRGEEVSSYDRLLTAYIQDDQRKNIAAGD